MREDNIINEMIRAFSENHLHMLTQIFNVLLLSGNIPHDWLIGIIKPIHKNKGDINDPDNYRRITLLSCLGNLFTSIVNERLTAFIYSTQIMSEAQDDFRKRYSTTDQIFTLRFIVELFYVKVEDCSALLLIIVRHLTRSTEQCFEKKLISYGVSGKST